MFSRTLLFLPFAVYAQGTLADYQRAGTLRTKYQAALNLQETPSWLDKGRFWYRKSVAGGHEFVLVDASPGVKAPAFGHERLAASLSKAAKASGCHRKLHYVDSSPPDQLQPKYMTIEYAKPGEMLDLQQPITNLPLKNYLCASLNKIVAVRIFHRPRTRNLPLRFSFSSCGA